MDKTKQFIRHELLNIFTIINHLLSEEKLTKIEREEALKMMKVATIMVAHEEILLGKNPKGFLQKVSLQDIIESQLLIAEEKLKRKKLQIKPLKGDPIIVLTDRYYFSEALGYILNAIFSRSSHVTFAFDEKKCQLVIQHDVQKILPVRAELKKALHEKHRDSTQIMLHLALTLLKAGRIKVQEKPNMIVLSLKK